MHKSRVSLFMMSAISRLLVAAVLVGLLWLGVFWALVGER